MSIRSLLAGLARRVVRMKIDRLSEGHGVAPFSEPTNGQEGQKLTMKTDLETHSLANDEGLSRSRVSIVFGRDARSTTPRHQDRISPISVINACSDEQRPTRNR